jgi:hypothetical protein
MDGRGPLVSPDPTVVPIGGLNVARAIGSNVTRSSKPALWLQQNAGKAIAIAFAAYVVLIFTAHVVPMSFWPAWVTEARGFAMGQLGPLGDSFAPLTAMFAAIAALGAWRSYSTQREQLEQDNARIEQEKGRHREQMERQREQLETLKNQHRSTRFDDTFFRLLEHYSKELAELSIDVPERERAFVHKTGKREKAEAVVAFKQLVKHFQFSDERFGKDVSAFAWGLQHKFCKPLILLRDQEIAITRWLKRQSRHIKVDLRGALLVAKLSDDELWFWYYAIQSTEDSELIAFATRLGINSKRAMDAENKPDDDANPGNTRVEPQQ